MLTFIHSKWKKTLLSLSLALTTVCLTGCWSINEINNIAIINVMGIDLNEKGDFEVTVGVVKPESLFKQTYVGNQGESQQERTLFETVSGSSLYEAIGKLSNSIPERIYFGHVNLVVLSERTAREKMVSSIDFLKREDDFRPNIQLLVTKGKASDIVRISPKLNSTLGLEVMDLTERNRFAAMRMVNDISQFSKLLSSNTTDPITGVITTPDKLGIKARGENVQQAEGQGKGSNESQSSNNSTPVSQNENQEVISLQGTAVFKEGNLKGYLNDVETRGLLLIKGDLQNDIIVLNCGEDKNGTVSLNVNETSSQLIPKMNGDRVKMVIDATVEADIGEVTCSTLEINSKTIDRLNRQLEAVMKEEASQVLLKAQKQWQTDIFGFGEAIYRKHPKKWDKMTSNWREGGLRDLEVDLRVEANISRYGIQKNPTKPNESR